MDSFVYLDNNATTMMSPSTIAEYGNWANRGNPSASYAEALKCREMMEAFRKYLQTMLNAPNYEIIFTSGATESNCMILRGIINTRVKNNDIGHVIVSAIEHKSILLLIEDAVRSGEIEATYIGATRSGHITAADVIRAIRPTTFLVIVMHANNETGAINDISAIGNAIHGLHQEIFFHSDIVQSFGKVPITLNKWHVNGAAISFHKIHGPPGVGAAIISRSCSSKLCPILYGTQNNGVRGGTENTPGIAAAFAAVREIDMMRTAKHEIELKKYLIYLMSTRAVCTTYDAYKKKYEMEIVFIYDSRCAVQYLHGTIMICAAKHIGPHACNKLIKDKLEEAGVIVSVGSACNTDSKNHSHVLRSMNVPVLLMEGAIRVSMSRYTKKEDISRFVEGFLAEALRQYNTHKSNA